MQHCCKFKSDDIYYLSETEFYPERKLAIGFCPICGKPVAELVQTRFDNIVEKKTYSGIEANTVVLKNKSSILYSVSGLNYKIRKSKPYGWKYGINKTVFVKGKEFVRQYACDFYGNKEMIKEV